MVFFIYSFFLFHKFNSLFFYSLLIFLLFYFLLYVSFSVFFCVIFFCLAFWSIYMPFSTYPLIHFDPLFSNLLLLCLYLFITKLFCRETQTFVIYFDIYFFLYMSYFSPLMFYYIYGLKISYDSFALLIILII